MRLLFFWNGFNFIGIFLPLNGLLAWYGQFLRHAQGWVVI